MSDEEIQEFADWLKVGIDRKWVSEPVCATHQGLPVRADEEAELEEGLDPCVPGVRVWIE